MLLIVDRMQLYVIAVASLQLEYTQTAQCGQARHLCTAEGVTPQVELTQAGETLKGCSLFSLYAFLPAAVYRPAANQTPQHQQYLLADQ